jgi:hypothetical protein
MNTGLISRATPRPSSRLRAACRGRVVPSLIAGVLLAVCSQFSASAERPNTVIHRPDAPSVIGIGSITAFDSIISLSRDKENAPSQRDDKFPVPADSSTDLNDDDGGWDDLEVDPAAIDVHDLFQCSFTVFDKATLGRRTDVEALLPSVRCFFCLRQHVRERAPPNLE